MARIEGQVSSCLLPGNVEVPLFIMKVDKRGICTTPRSRKVLLDRMGEADVTDVIVASHGWNTSPEDAISTYESWMQDARSTLLDLPAPFNPVVVGIVWPSAWFVLPWERGPHIAAEDGERSQLTEVPDDVITDLAEDVAADRRGRFYELVDVELLTDAEAEDLLGLLTDDQDDEAPSVASLLAAARLLADEQRFVPDDDDAVLGRGSPSPGGEPAEAGAAGNAPRMLLRAASVWKMKDRAATVGANAVAELLRDLAGSGAKIHCVGHSFGAKVLLSAMSGAHTQLAADSIESALLIQPAMNGYALADDIPGRHGEQGGHRPAFDVVRQPILSTFSKRDRELRLAFHLAVRRKDDLGEPTIAADPDEPPSVFAALGGWGPQGTSDAEVIEMPASGSPYPSAGAAKLLALRAHEQIRHHGDHNNAATHWALRSLIAGLR